MVKIRILRGNEYKYISLQELCETYYKTAPENWFLFVEQEIDEALNIKTENEYQEYLESHGFIKMITKAGHKFEYLEIKRFYEVLKKSKYNQMFDDDILKYISYIRELGFFDIIDYKLDKDNPDLDEWFKSKNAFKYGLTEDELQNAYSITDLLPLKYGMNAIRGQLLKANKKIW